MLREVSIDFSKLLEGGQIPFHAEVVQMIGWKKNGGANPPLET